MGVSGAVVAVVAGDTILRHLLTATLPTLQGEGYVVLAPADFAAPLPTPPRVVLLDPWAVTADHLGRLRDQWGQTAVIALVDQAADAAPVPAVAILEKPFDLHDLLALVRQYASPT